MQRVRRNKRLRPRLESMLCRRRKRQAAAVGSPPQLLAAPENLSDCGGEDGLQELSTGDKNYLLILADDLYCLFGIF